MFGTAFVVTTATAVVTVGRRLRRHERSDADDYRRRVRIAVVVDEQRAGVLRRIVHDGDVPVLLAVVQPEEAERDETDDRQREADHHRRARALGRTCARGLRRSWDRSGRDDGDLGEVWKADRTWADGNAPAASGCTEPFGSDDAWRGLSYDPQTRVNGFPFDDQGGGIGCGGDDLDELLDQGGGIGGGEDD
jgi:hypothetical protein